MICIIGHGYTGGVKEIKLTTFYHIHYIESGITGRDMGGCRVVISEGIIIIIFISIGEYVI
jgi:hypothetical protein